jgi:hypothetical protein
MASQYALNEALPVDEELALTGLADRLQLLQSELAQPNQPPRYAVWLYPRAHGRSNVALAAVRQNSVFT